jgi:hypothetical protein
MAMENRSKIDLISIIELILKHTKSSRFQKTKLDIIRPHIEKLSHFLQINSKQSLLFALVYGLTISNSKITIRDLADFTKISVLKFTANQFENLELLSKKGIIKKEFGHRERKELGNISYFVSREIQDAILDECLPQKKEIIPKDTLTFLAKFQELVEEKDELRQDYDEFMSGFKELIDTFSENKFIQKAEFFNFDDYERLAFYKLFHETLVGDPEVDIDSFYKIIYSDQKRKYMMSRSFIHKYSNLLFSNNFIEHETGFLRNSQFLILTKHALEYFLLEENLYNVDQPTNQKDVLDYHKIPKTNLYFNPNNQEEISFLSRSLAQKQFKAIQLKLHHENLRKGINVLFYGSPGTGKTELAFQLAKKHKRAIMQVDISKLKSMYYGESQKLLKNLFIRYNRLIENNSATPIMLFNEADAYLSKRLTNISSSTDQTSNALQNIILEEMEKHQGVIIATTNLTDNLDNAMERRFLFKVNFQQPNTQTKFLIWKDKLPEVEPIILKELATSYDLSGGQIENVVRKYQMNKVLGKNIADLKLMHTFCMAENFTTKTRIGFK